MEHFYKVGVYKSEGKNFLKGVRKVPGKAIRNLFYNFASIPPKFLYLLGLGKVKNEKNNSDILKKST